MSHGLAHEDREGVVLFVFWAIQFVRQVSEAMAVGAFELTTVVQVGRHRTVPVVTAELFAVCALRA